MRSSSSSLSIVTGRDNPFWNNVLRRTRRRGEVDDWLLPLVLTLFTVVPWLCWSDNVPLAERFPYGPWHYIIAAQALVIILGTALRAARMMRELGEPANLIALRLSRIGPGLTVAAKAVEPFLAGARLVLAGLPLLVLLSAVSDKPHPSLAGIATVELALVVYVLCLAAGTGAAAARTRGASVDDWGNLLFNLRTLFPLFLNPLWCFLVVLLLLGGGPALADWLVRPRAWFNTVISPFWLALPLLCWAARHGLALAVYTHTETPRLSRGVTLWMIAGYFTAALLLTGFSWPGSFVGGGLVGWWEVAATPPRVNAARLLLAVLGWTGYPLCLAAAATATITRGLRGDLQDPLDRLPRPAPALLRIALAALMAGLVPVGVYAVAMLCGGWEPAVAGRDYLLRTVALLSAAALLGAGYLTLLVLLPRWRGYGREVATVAVALPPLLAPFACAAKSAGWQAVTVLSPLTSLLWLPPDAGTGSGMTGEVRLLFAWPQLVVWQLVLAVVLFALAGRMISVERRVGQLRGGRELAALSGWRRYVKNPVFSLDLLRLQRRGALLSPLVMLAMPVIAKAYGGLDEKLEHLVHEACSLFLWDQPLPFEPRAVRLLALIFATVGVQLVIHPGGFAASRSFARDDAGGRLDELLASTLSTREIVLGRYLAVVSPVTAFILTTAPGLLWWGSRVEFPRMLWGGLLHWLGLAMVVPAAILAGTVERDWRGQGVGTVVLLELGRVWVSRALLAGLPLAWGVCGAGLLFCSACLLVSWVGLDLCTRRLAARREQGAA